MNLHRAWLATLVASCLPISQAFASPTYPPTIQADLGLAQAPDCTLCHKDDVGGAGTVIRPFGRTMIERFQLTGGNNLGALKAALAESDAQHVDSDGDGVSDIDELRMGTDPNVGLSGVEAAPDVPLPETGCGFSQHAPAFDITCWGLMFAALCLLARRVRHS